MGRLLTPQQLMEEFNLPSLRTVQTLRAQGLPSVKLGAARLIDYDDMVAFVEKKKERPPSRSALPNKHERVIVRGSSDATKKAYEHLLAAAGRKNRGGR